MKFGARIFKTGIAITLALILATLIELPSPVFAGIAAVFAIQPSIYRSYLSVVEQVQANFIGALFAIGFAVLFGTDPFIIGFTAIVVIAITLKLKIEKTIPIAVVTVIALMETPDEQFIQFAIIRFLTILLGILSAFVVNLAFLPPKYEKKLYFQIVEQTEEIIKWIRVNTRHASEHNTLKTEIEKFKENIMKIDQLYLLYKEERNYFKKNKLAKSRKLVLFRQMIASTNQSFETLKHLHRLQNELHQMPIEFQQLFIKEIDDIIHYHEQILLKIVGKIKSQPPEELQRDFAFDRKKVINTFLETQQTQDSQVQEAWYMLLTLVSSIVDYNEQLEHLNLLVDSFQNYHKSENEFEMVEQ